METREIGLKLFLKALLLVITAEAIMLLFFPGPSEISRLYLLGLARIIEILGLILLFYWHYGNIAALGLTRSGIGRGIKRGLIWSLGFGLLVLILFSGLYIFYANPFEWLTMKLPPKISDLLLFFLVGSLIAPAAEEIFFRGLLYGFFRRWGVVIALIVSTSLFVLAHIPFNPLPLPQAIGGILFALAYELEKNLYTPLVIHILGNLSIFLLSFYPVFS